MCANNISIHIGAVRHTHTHAERDASMVLSAEQVRFEIMNGPNGSYQRIRNNATLQKQLRIAYGKDEPYIDPQTNRMFNWHTMSVINLHNPSDASLIRMRSDVVFSSEWSITDDNNSFFTSKELTIAAECTLALRADAKTFNFRCHGNLYTVFLDQNIQMNVLTLVCRRFKRPTVPETIDPEEHFKGINLDYFASFIAPPDELICPIGLSIMRNPVKTVDGMIYDHANISKWFDEGKQTSPKTGLILRTTLLLPDSTRIRLLRQYREKVIQNMLLITSSNGNTIATTSADVKTAKVKVDNEIDGEDADAAVEGPSCSTNRTKMSKVHRKRSVDQMEA